MPPPPESYLLSLFKSLAGMPVAVVRGERSPFLRKEHVARMARHKPDLTTAVVPDVGHAPILVEAEALDLVDRWLVRIGYRP